MIYNEKTKFSLFFNKEDATLFNIYKNIDDQ